MYYYDFLESPMGLIKITASESALVSLSLITQADIIATPNIITDLCKTQFNEYFMNQRREFTLPLEFNGTKFQKSVWNELLKIPYGKTTSYKDVAVSLGNPNASRAVGGAVNKNPLFIVVPCHRVIGSNGALVGFALGIDKKTYLLDIEKNHPGK
ncbi:methylated-DNA--[protein]-cysteine S-methyltransferase [Clostridium intestinale]|uniref:Methylated-DNA--protein-cysteine methyltransferase n=1 Tax=Clostridium intestinale DSM 6191 TaxID=1121320 RepID=A0A1M5ZE61_9CLOT|nr:methylated-DNA--[protein]-cysteine S-methyltransferase [Clostridium intestinale]SHI22461.1 methylated-DNA-[protein]-cysteine S-methyltransferase [Clostridium intestinale DSM 6191]